MGEVGKQSGISETAWLHVSSGELLLFCPLGDFAALISFTLGSNSTINPASPSLFTVLSQANHTPLQTPANDQVWLWLHLLEERENTF